MATAVADRDGERRGRRSAVARRRAVLNFVTWHIGRHGYAPTLRDICAACGISSVSAASYSVRSLHERGLLRHAPRVSRGITLAPG